MSDEHQESQENEKVEEAKEAEKVEEAVEAVVTTETEKVEETVEAVVTTEAEVDEEAKKTEEAEEPLNIMKISELSPFDRKLQITFVVIEKGETRSIVSRKTNEEHQLADIQVGDTTGSIKCTLWDETIDRVSVGSTYMLKNGYVNVFQGEMRLALGKWGSLEDTEELIKPEEVKKDNDRSKEQHEDRRRRRSYQRGGGSDGGGSSGGYGDDRARRPRSRDDAGGYRGKPSDEDRW
jgi:ssDNA-binding replication factor A large subunit